MIVTFDREPFGWVHPFYRTRRHLHHPIMDWNSFVLPAMETVDTLNQLLQMANNDESPPRLAQPIQPNDKFELKIDVQQFAPDELDVKMVDNFVVIEGKHEEKKDEHGFITRHFVRRYQLPKDVKPEAVTCNLSSDGVLYISAPRVIEQNPVNERTLPINFTGQPAVTNEKKPEALASEAAATTDKGRQLEGAHPNPIDAA